MKKSSTQKIKISNGLKVILTALVLVLFAGINKVKAQSPYCDPYYTYSCYQYRMSINALEIKQGSTSLYSRAHNTGGYDGCTATSGYYTLWSSSSMFTLKANGTYKFGFTTGPTYNVNVGIWIDLNGDKDFADANEMLPIPSCQYGTGNVPAGTSTLTYYDVKIPAGITPGVTRMRIRSIYYYTTCWNSGDNGCTSMYYGEAEDFTITLASDPNDAGIAAITTPLCGPKLKATIANNGSNDINPVQVGWTVNGSPQTSNTYSSTITKLGGTAEITLSPDYNFVDGNVYTVQVFTYSPNNTTDPDKTNDTMTAKFKYIGPAGKPTTYDSKRCGPGKSILKATTPYQTDSVVWFSDSIGGSSVAKGKNAISPLLYLGVNKFYAQSFKMSQPASLINGMSGNYILSGSAGYNGTMVDITPLTDMVIDSFVIHLYYSTPGSTSEVYFKTGSYSGYEKNSSVWTKVQDGVMRVDASGSKYYGYIKINELALKKGVTYGFYITCSATTGNDLYATYGNATISNSDLSVTGGTYIYGQFASTGVYSPYNPDLGTFYRTSTCPSERVPIKITVNPAPNGAAFTKSTPFQTTQPNTNGYINNPDIVAEGDQLTYELQPPTGYTNSGHGSTWLTLTPVVKSKTGTDIPSGTIWSWTAPTSTSPGKLIFKPSKSMTDTMYIISMQLKDLGPYYCDSSILRHIFVAPRPVPDFKFNQPVCDGDAVLFDNLSTISTGGLKYRWDFGTGNVADTSDAYTTVFKFPTFGIYNVTLKTTSLPYGYVESKTISVVVTEIPKIGFKVLNACENVPIQFVNNTTIGAGTVTYLWDFGDPTTTLDKSTSKNPTWTYKTPGAYQVKLIATSSGCKSELVKNANQFSTPVAKFTYPTLICDKSDVQFTNGSTIKTGNMGYLWDFGDGGISTFSNPTHKYANATSKTVKLKTISEFGCTDSVSKSLVLQESPKADFSYTTPCNLTSTNFTFTGTRPNSPILTVFNWNFSGEGTTTIENPSKLFSVVGKKLVTLTLTSNNGCTDAVTKEVNVKLQSKADFEAADVCDGDDAVFINKSTVSQGNLVYNWKFGDSKTSNLQSPRHRYNITSTQSFNVTLSAIVPGGCSDSTTRQVTVNANPNSDFGFKTSGRLVYFTAAQQGSTLYQWRFGDGGSSNTANPQYSYLIFPKGKYMACLSVVNVSGCFSETCKEVAISGGIDKVSKLSGVKIYPNPSKGNFTVTVEDPKSDISISVYNLLGDVVKTIQTSPLKSVYNIDLNVANGIYMVKVTNGGLTSTQKVTINK